MMISLNESFECAEFHLDWYNFLRDIRPVHYSVWDSLATRPGLVRILIASPLSSEQLG